MGKDVAGIVVTADTLQCTPDAWEAREETEEARVCRVALCWVIPVVRVQTEEQFNILSELAFSMSYLWISRTYTQGICQRTEHISQKEITKLHRV